LLAALLCGLDKHPSLSQVWPAGWASAPRGVSVRGIELMRVMWNLPASTGTSGPASRIRAGRYVSNRLRPGRYGCHPGRSALRQPCWQDDVLRRVKTALTPDGTLLLRVGNAAAGLPFHISNWVDMIVTFVRGNRLSSLYCRTLHDWQQALTGLGFEVQTLR